MRLGTLALTAAALAATLAVAGCAPAGTGTATDRPTDSSPAAADGSFNSADTTFLSQMIPHHEQAIEMSEIVLATDGVDQRVVSLAEQIIAAQDPEIQTMTGWLDQWGVPDDGSTSDMGDMDHGDGIMSDEDLAELDDATGVEAARIFLEDMIIHHEGAVVMARQVLDTGENSDVADLARRIIDTQTAEIAEMQGILATL